MTTKPNNKVRKIDLLAVVLLLIICVSWGLGQVAIKVANKGVSPLLQAGIRSFGAALLLWLWMMARKKPLFEKDGTLWWGLGVGFLFAAEFVFIYWGLEFTNASRAVIFLYMAPFVVAIGAQFFIPDEKLRPIQVAGLGIAFCGILFAFGESLQLPSYRMFLGDAMLAAAAVIWGATTVLVKSSPLIKIEPSKTLLYQLAVSALVLPLGSLALNEPGIINLSPLVIASLIYQTVWIAAITYLVWFWLIRHYPAARLSAFTFLTPLFGVLAGSMLLDEPLTRVLLLALVCVATGIYLVNRPKDA